MIDMHDYPRTAKTAWIVFAVIGAMLIALSATQVWQLRLELLVQFAIGTGCALIASVFPIKQPNSKVAISASDLFLFLVLCVAGTAAAVIATALDAFMAALRSSKRWTSRLGSTAFCAIGMFLAGAAYQYALGWISGMGIGRPEAILAALLICATVYFAVHDLLITAIFQLKACQRISLSEWIRGSYWFWLMLLVPAIIAGLLFITVERVGAGALMVAAPVVLLAASSLHYYFGTVEVRMQQLKDSEDHLKKLAASEEKFHKAFDKAAIGLALVDENLDLIQVNEAFSRITGEFFTRGTVKSIKQFLPPENRRTFQSEFDSWKADGVAPFVKEMRIACADPRECWVHATLSVFETDAHGRRSLILQINDVTARRLSESKLQFLAFHDPLTGLKNRPYLMEAMQNAIALSGRDSSYRFAVVMLDFNRFKLINDSLGHAAGDELLVKVAQRLRSNVRDHDVVARFGGDEFAILLQQLASDTDALELTQRLSRSIAEPLTVAGLETSISASFGITFGRFGYTRADDALRDADLAMYESKRAGNGQTVVFSGAMHEKVTRLLRIEADLRLALKNDQLALALQPIWDFHRNENSGHEALVRWIHPTQGLQAPGEFIPVAEETGMIEEIGQWVAHEALNILTTMTQRAVGGRAPIMAINVSPRQLSGGMFVTWLINRVASLSIQPAQIMIELTEQAMSDAKTYILDELRRLRAAGFLIALDDFGTGYSSLSHLQNIPATHIKLDRIFTQRLVGAQRDRDIAQAIVALAHSLGMKVCAEGVETVEQFEAVRTLGCDSVQGFYIGKPELIDVAMFTQLEVPADRNAAPQMLPAPPGLH
jgi:diguanylate cyclase (GGDEF)-like protein/PAS domain S-box-containing protein